MTIEPTDTPISEVQVGDFIDSYLGYGEVTEIRHRDDLRSLWIILPDPNTD